MRVKLVCRNITPFQCRGCAQKIVMQSRKGTSSRTTILNACVDEVCVVSKLYEVYVVCGVYAVCKYAVYKVYAVYVVYEVYAVYVVCGMYAVYEVYKAYAVNKEYAVYREPCKQ